MHFLSLTCTGKNVIYRLQPGRDYRLFVTPKFPSTRTGPRLLLSLRPLLSVIPGATPPPPDFISIEDLQTYTVFRANPLCPLFSRHRSGGERRLTRTDLSPARKYTNSI